MNTLNKIAAILTIACLGTVLTAQQPTTPPPTTTSGPAAPLLVEEFRKTVGFMRVTYLDGTDQKEIGGTCFFVTYPDKRLGNNEGFGYLVTNRHMAVPGIELGAHFPVIQVSVRLNLRSLEAGAESFEGVVPIDDGVIPIKGAPQWFLPADDAVDLAVLPFAPDTKRFDIEPINASILATKDKIRASRIDAGDTVIFAGYFYQWPGSRKIQPIVRQGVIAMMPDEEIKTTLQKPGYLYLADVHAFHGNSGSPLLVNVGGVRSNVVSSSGYLLLGVVSGYYPEGESFSVPAAKVLTGDVHDNSGIATIVPAYELQQLLDSAPLQAARDAEIRTRTKTAQP